MEDLEYLAEDEDGGANSQAWVPLRIISRASSTGRLPTVIFLHATGTLLCCIALMCLPKKVQQKLTCQHAQVQTC